MDNCPIFQRDHSPTLEGGSLFKSEMAQFWRSVDNTPQLGTFTFQLNSAVFLTCCHTRSSLEASI
jgi:hypothetical protein